MKRVSNTQTQVIVISIILCFLLAGCASNTPWRKATVTTFELVGATIEQTRPTTEMLYRNKLIDDTKLAKIKALYNSAVDFYEKAGRALKLAGQTEDTIKRNAELALYEQLLGEFKKLSLEIHKLIMQK